MSDAAHLRMAAATPEYRKALTAAAHEARRGQVDSWEVRVNRSAGMRENRVGMFELETIERLAQLGVKADSQEPFGPYNIDILIEECAVAVEIYSSHPETYRMPYLKERCEYMLDFGVSMLIVQCAYPRRVFKIDRVCDQIIAFMDVVRRNKTARGQYGVIRGHGEIAASSSHYIDHIAPVMTF